MAEERIDSLSIEIVSSAERAVKGLENIAKSTDKVGKALKNVKTSGLDKVSKDAVDSAKSIESLNSKLESLFAKGETAGKKFFNVDDMGLKEAENKLKVLQRQYDNIRDTINTKLISGITGGTTLENQVINAGKYAVRLDMVKERIDALKSAQDSMKPLDFFEKADWQENTVNVNDVGQALSEMEDEFLSSFKNVSSEAGTVGEAIKKSISKVPVSAEEYDIVRDKIRSLTQEVNTLGEAISSRDNKSLSTDAIDKYIAKGQELEALKKELASMEVVGGFENIGAEISEATSMLQGFKDMLDFTKTSVKDVLTGIGEKTGIHDYSKEYYSLKDSISKTKEEAEALKNQIDSMGAKGQTMPLSEEKLDKLNSKLDKMREKLADIEGQGKGFHMFGKMKDGLSGIGSKIGGLFSQGDSEGTSRAFRSTGKSSNALGKGLKNVLGLMKKLVPSSKSLKGVLGGLGLTSNGLSKSLLRTGKMLKLMVVRMALRGVITGAKEGFQNLIQYSDSTKASMQQLVSSLDYLKNSFAAAFAPAINVAAPILSKFIDYLVSAVNQINQLVSSLLGFSTWTKATKLVSNYGNAVGGVGKAAKETNKQLQPFDELNNLTMNQGGGSGGGSGAGTNYADMFTTEEVDGYWKSIADRIKDSWNFDDADFTWLGASLGEKISEQLDGLIDKHPKIKDNARKIGKALGTTITGFVETPNLGYKVGTVIGNAIDTAVTGLDGFVSNVHWDSVGEFIGQGINGIKDTELIHDVFTLLKNSINGAINFLWSSGNEIDFKGIGGKIGEELSEAISGLEAEKAGEAISTWIGGALQGITEFLKKTDFETAGQKIADFLNGIDWGGLAWDLLELAKAIITALKDAIVGLWNDSSTQTKIGLAVVGLFGTAKLTGLTGKLQTAFTNATGDTLSLKIKSIALSAGLLAISYETLTTEPTGNPKENLKNAGLGVGSAGLAGGILSKTLGIGTPSTVAGIFAEIAAGIKDIQLSWQVGKLGGEALAILNGDWELADYYADYKFGDYTKEFIDDPKIATNAYLDFIRNSGRKLGVALGTTEAGHNTPTDILYDVVSGLFGSPESKVMKDEGVVSQQFLRTYGNQLTKQGASVTTAQAAAIKYVDEYTKALQRGTTEIEAHQYALGAVEKTLKTYNVEVKGTTKYSNEVQKEIFNENKQMNNLKKTASTLVKNGLSPYGKAITNVGTKLKSLIGINDKTTKSNNDFSKSYQSNSDKVTKATTGMSNNIQNSRANIIGSMDKIGLSFDGTYNKINTGAENSSKTVDAKFQYMKLMATAHTEEQRKAIETKYGQMVDTTKTNSSGMQKSLLSNLKQMSSDTSSNTSQMQSTVSKWSEAVKKLVGNTKANAKFGVETPTQSSISQKYRVLKNIWKKWGVPFWVSTEQTETDVPKTYKQLKELWKNHEAKFSMIFTADSSTAGSLANKAIDKIKQAFNNSGIQVLKNAASKLKFFAKGGVVDKATLGIFGEAGTEAIMPLERNTEWIGKLSTQIVAEMPSMPTYQSSSNESAILEQNRLLAEQNALLRQIANKDVSISSRDVFNAVRNENNDFINRTGASPFFV